MPTILHRIGERLFASGKIKKKDRYSEWLQRNPDGNFKQFYAESLTGALAGEREHASIGPNLKPRGARSARRAFDKLVALGLSPSDTLVDYGCGTLRIGVPLIEFLDPDCYIGLDIDERILAAGRSRIPEDFAAAKRPVLQVISPDSLRMAASRKPKWLWSKGVLQHVPPEDLSEFFENLSLLVHAGATGWLSARIGSTTEQLSSKTWTHEFSTMQAAARRHGLELESGPEGLLRLGVRTGP